MAVEATGLSALTGATLVSQNATAVAIARGIRVVLDSSTTVSAAGQTVRGDFVAAAPVAASGTGAFVPLQLGCIVPMVTDGTAFVVNDTVYSAASGKVNKTSSGAQILGKAYTAAAAVDGTLFEVLLTNPL